MCARGLFAKELTFLGSEDVQALSASSGDRSGPDDTSKADWSQMASARETHGVMPNPRQVASEGKRSPSSKSALHKGFTTFFCELGNSESPMWD